MTHIKLLLPRTLVDFNEATDTVFFLAGPIKGANDWQKDAIKLLQKYAHTPHDGGNIYVVCPSIYKPNHELYSLRTTGIIKESHTKKQKKTTTSRTDWERHHLEIASRLGCIIFWLGKEDKKNPRKREDGPYARDTYGELGEWRARIYYEWKYGHTQINLVIGAHPDFPGLEQIERNFKRMVGEDFKISNTMDETIKMATVIKAVKNLNK